MPPARLLPLIAAVALAPAGVDVGREAIATTLGRAHALHRLCAGPEDDLWRGRMQAMLAAEHATPAQRNRLVGRFNVGYADASRAFATCSPRARAALAETARRGRDEAAALAQGER